LGNYSKAKEYLDEIIELLILSSLLFLKGFIKEHGYDNEIGDFEESIKKLKNGMHSR
jgi:hypothetical protein